MLTNSWKTVWREHLDIYIPWCQRFIAIISICQSNAIIAIIRCSQNIVKNKLRWLSRSKNLFKKESQIIYRLILVRVIVAADRIQIEINCKKKKNISILSIKCKLKKKWHSRDSSVKERKKTPIIKIVEISKRTYFEDFHNEFGKVH